MPSPTTSPPPQKVKSAAQANSPVARDLDVPTVTAVPAQGATAPHKHYRISAASLQIGMFVVELDRPWIDTPFLLQGFLIDGDAELSTLRRFCKYVIVDLDMSNPEVVEAIREAALAALEDDGAERKDFRGLGGSGASHPDKPAGKSGARRRVTERPRSERRVTQETRERFRELIRSTSGLDSENAESGGGLTGWFRSIKGLFSRDEGAPQALTRSRMQTKAAREDAQAALLKDLPAGTQLTRYTERHDAVEEMPRARRSLDRSERILARLVTDVRSGSVPQIEQVQAAVGDMVDSMVDNPDALMWVARLRDESTNAYLHGVKMALYMISLGRHLGLPKDQLSALGSIGMLADVGKIKLPRALLDKPGMLTPSEYSIVKEHVRIGLDALDPQRRMPPEVHEGIAQHHERMDGSGYPKGLSGSEISIWGRISAIADTFAALTSTRPYANALAPQEALLNLYEWAGSSFHEPLVEQFVQSVGVFPVGSLIELSSGELAVVVAQNRVRRLEPKVLVLTWPDKRPLAHPIERDLFRVNASGDGKRLRIARGLPAGAFGLKLRDFYADSLVQSNSRLL